MMIDKKKIVLDLLPEIKLIAGYIYNRYGKPFNNPVLDIEDLIHEGVIGVYNAFDDYDNNKNIEFKKYAKIRIRQNIFDRLFEKAPLKRHIARKYKEEGKEIKIISHEFIIDSISNIDLESDYIDHELYLKLRQIVRELPQRQKQSIEEYYLNQKSFKIICKEMGTKPSTLSGYIKKGLNNLKDSIYFDPKTNEIRIVKKLNKTPITNYSGDDFCRVCKKRKIFYKKRHMCCACYLRLIHRPKKKKKLNGELQGYINRNQGLSKCTERMPEYCDVSENAA